MRPSALSRVWRAGDGMRDLSHRARFIFVLVAVATGIIASILLNQ